MAATETDNAGLPVPPPLLAIGALVLAIVLELVPVALLERPVGLNAQVVIGIVLTAGGLWLGGAAFMSLTAAGTNVDPGRPTLKIVTGGPYRFTRNPIYLGMVLALAGISLIFSLEWGVVLAVLFWIVLDRMVVRREEAYLTGKFGAEYQALLNRTRRWI